MESHGFITEHFYAQSMQIDDLVSDSPPAHRIGALSRLSGVPVTTLRVWETRYSAFRPAKTAGQHRLYDDHDVLKARLLRQLSAAGHAIGAIAGLPLATLQGLAPAAASLAGPAPASSARARLSAWVIDHALALRLQGEAWQTRWQGDAPEVRRVFANLQAVQEAAPPAPDEAPALLLARLNALHPRSHEQLLETVDRLGPGRVIVLYNFGAEALVESLRAAGIQVRREPVSDAELAELVRSEVVVEATAAAGGAAVGGLIPRRRYTDAQLARVAASPSRVLCECPRHIAELVQQLASFEAYSAECLADSAEDARLHAYLRSVAGSSRALFEHALDLAVRHAGLAPALAEAPQDPDTGAVAATQQTVTAPPAQ